MSSLTPVAREGHRRLQCRRSRNGCVTCKRRKVRCNEQKPKCYHCHRLNLECIWKDAGPEHASPPRNGGRSGRLRSNIGTPLAERQSPSAGLFDFVNSMTDLTDDSSFLRDLNFPGIDDFIPPGHVLPERELPANLDDPSPRPSTPQASIPSANADEPFSLHIPPILDPVENGPKCASVRALFESMATSSPMVRYAMAAFAAIQIYTSRNEANYRQYYDKASNELSEELHKPGGVNCKELRYILTTIFFLTYINFLTGRMDLACLNLAKAHNALQTAGREALGALEQRIISWIRLVDARAASAGGEGLLVNDTSGIYPSSPSSAASGSSPETRADTDSGSREVIYDMLCQPGIAFFQEVQTITGRITRIAHDHRSRGTVEDETEVMAIAADILKDLSSLHDRRPPLMDHAISGNISSDTLAEPLASAIIRSFQTYLANFYACYIHLHRVAHRHLPHSNVVVTALRKIKEMMHLMAGKNESIPVNMLWPLFLWGSEEDDYGECQWILETIRSLRHVVTNANMAADVLQELQRRQREAGTRIHISSVCKELYNATFVMI